jgi:hypothetical protein
MPMNGPTRENGPTTPKTDQARETDQSLKEIMDFSFAEVLPEKPELIETGGSCCSCS